MSDPKPPVRARGDITVVGLGNIGSQVVPLLAGVSGARRVRLVDFDRYETGNSGFQGISPTDAGKAKARVQARALRALAPHLSVDAHCIRIESVPLGLLRDSTILCCVDSRAARQSVNRIAFALGIPWLDAALSREGSVRARAYVPGSGECIECAWGPGDYALIEQRIPCETAAAAAAATRAPLELGALAAAMQVALYRRLLEDASAASELAHRQWFIDVHAGRGWTGRYAPNPDCRLDHGPWSIAALARGAGDLTLREAAALSGDDAAQNAIAADGHSFVQRVRCARCARVRQVGCRLSGRIAQRTCSRCAVPMIPGVADAQERLSLRNACPGALDRPLAHFGFVDGDIIAVHGPQPVAHFQLGVTTGEGGGNGRGA